MYQKCSTIILENIIINMDSTEARVKNMAMKLLISVIENLKLILAHQVFWCHYEVTSFELCSLELKYLARYDLKHNINLN